MVSDDEEKDSKAAPAPTTTIKGEVPCVSPPVYEEDNDDNDDDDNNNDDTDKEDDNDENKEDNDDDNEEDIRDFDLNDVNDMSEYEVLRLQRIHRNNVKLASLGLLGGMTSTTSPSADRTYRKKLVALQGDFVRRVQPNCNVFKPHLTRILVTLSSARERVPSILLTGERRILSARGWMRWSTAPVAGMKKRRTMMRT